MADGIGLNVVVPEVPGLQEFLATLDRYDDDLTKVLIKHMRTVTKVGNKLIKSYMRSWKGPIHDPAPSFVKSIVKRDTPRAIFGRSGPSSYREGFFGRIEITGRGPGRFVDPDPAIRGRKRSATKARIGKVNDAMAGLAAWAEDKLGVSPEEAPQVAFAIAKSISRKGTKGSNAAEKAKPQAEALAIAEFTAALDEMMAILEGNKNV